MTAPTREVALDHYEATQDLVDATALVAGQMWAEVDPGRVVDSWAAQVPEMTAVLSGAQLAAARQADPYLDESLNAQDLPEDAVSPINPAGFSGHASDGRGLLGLLTSPALMTILTVADGVDILRAMQFGRVRLDTIVRTQVSDAARLADQVALTARPAATGYIRQTDGNPCARCLILAGRTYQWNSGFLRHPRCGCIHVPTLISHPRWQRLDPRSLYDRMTPRERLRAGFTLGDQRAIEAGADINQVVNAQRGVFVAGRRGGRRIRRPDGTTTEGTTRLGLAGQRLGRGVPRLTPDQIFVLAGDSRDRALELLHRHGYLLMMSRSSRTLAAAGDGVAVRRILADADSAEAVSTVLAAELKRVTGRDIRVDLKGSVATAREHAEGVLRVAEQYPDVAINEVVTDRLLLAYAEWDNGRLIFSERYSSLDRRRRYLEELAGDADAKWHPYSDPVGMAVHEMGHALDVGTLGRSIRTQLDEIMSSSDAARVSGYAAQNVDEFVAEAFADVLMNGPRAHALSRQVVDLLDDAYRTRGVPGTGRALATPDVSRMTVPQLRQLLSDAGVAFPPRALKAELVTLARGIGRVAAAPVKATARAAKATAARPAAPQFDLQRAMRDQGVSQGQLDEVRELIRIRDARIHIGGEAEDFIGRSLINADPVIAAFYREHRDIYNHLAQQFQIDKAWRDSAGVHRLVEAQQAATRTVRAAAAPETPIVVRTSTEEQLRQILSDGRLKTQFETGRSSGFMDADLRADFEQMSFGLPRDLPVGERPVYGYFAVGGLDADTGSRLAQFGEVRIVLRDGVRRRTTVSVGDSLDRRRELRPMPVDDADWHAVQPSLAEVDYDTPAFRDNYYVEAQVHGGVRTQDVAEVVFRSPPEPATVAALRRARVKWRVEGAPVKAAKKAAAPAKAAKRVPARAASPDLTGARGLSTDPAVREVQIENRIREAFLRAPRTGWTTNPGGVRLADLRDELGESVNRHELDEALARMGRRRGVDLQPNENRKELTQADLDSAVTIGPIRYHTLYIDDASLSPLPSSAPAKKAAKAAPAKKATKAAAPPAPSRMSTPALRTELERAGVTVPPRTAKPALVDEVTALRGGASADEIGARLNPPTAPVIDRTLSPAEVMAQETAVKATSLAAPPVKMQHLPPRGAGTAALKYYQRHGDAHMLGLMRRGKVGLPPGAKRADLPSVESVQGQIDQIRQLMDQSRLTEGITVYRGMSGGGMFRSRDSLVGRTFTDKGFVSTSADRRVASQFMAGEGMASDGVLLEIRVPPGVGAIQISDDTFAGHVKAGWGSEREILLEDGLRFRIVSDEMLDDVYLRGGTAHSDGGQYRHVVVEVIR